MKRRRHGLRKFVIILLLLVVVAVATFLCLERRIKPHIAAAASSKVYSLATNAMNSAVLEYTEDVQYDNLINVIKDNDGHVSMLQGNAFAMNQLGMKVAIAAQENIASVGEQGVSIRLGTLIGSSFFDNIGPKIKVLLEPEGSVSPTFISDFESTAINQTLHKIKLRLEAKVRVVFGGKTVESTELICEVPIAESLIVGVVPDSYVNLPSEQKKSSSGILNLLP